MAAKDKDTIYIDIDDEITGIIDKLHASEAKVVALVLPKRAAAFQSIVNMKLLKRAADGSKKNLVLITSEAGLLPLAGAAGVHVAKTLTSKPEIPSAPDAAIDDDEAVQEDGSAAEASADGDKTVGELAGAGAAAGAAKPAADGVETLTLDDDDLPPEDAAAVKPKSFEPPKGKKNKKLHIPNFERFRLLLILGGALLVLIIGILLFITFSLPKATITIKTDATNVSTNLDLNLSTTAQSLDPINAILPAKLASQQKTYTEQVPTTGQKNNGTKASGPVTIINCGPSDVTIPAGTGFSSGGNTYISQADVTVPQSDFKFDHTCKNNGAASVNVAAQNGGSSYNLPSGANFTIAGGPAYTTAQGGTISGGTDNIVQTVNQNDINNAKAKVNTNDSQFKQTLHSQLTGGDYYPLDATYQTGTPDVSSSANVGAVATAVTVTETITYTMFGVHQSDLTTLIDNQVNTQIDTSKQSVLDTGLNKAVFNVNTISATGAQLTMSTTAVAGPHLDVNTIKQQAAGQHAGAVRSQLSGNPDVTSVDVKFSPFWVSTVPKKTSRITVNIAKPTTSAKSSNSSGSNP